MMILLSKPYLILGFLPLALICSNARGQEVAHQGFYSMPRGVYLGAFGGGGHYENNSFTQQGTALYGPNNGGPLSVNAKGNTDTSAIIIGMHVGYEWLGWLLNTDKPCWKLVPAAEFEGYYLGNKLSGQLSNPTTRLPEHLFEDSFQMNTGVFLANSVWVFKSPYKIDPYFGAGIGAAILSFSNANSVQVSPAEPGINHFNSNPNASSWAFAAQAKAGLRFNLSEHGRLFAEYRFLYLSSTDYTFGSTVYPTHIPTTKWKVNFASMHYNMGAIGFEYDFC